jgi:hypothetical protein
MDAAHTIRDAVARVSQLRLASAGNPPLGAAISSVKRFQARRFAGTYADLLQSAKYQGASRFFLDELYSERDYTLRDAQFARIASPLQTLFPAAVAAVAVSMAQLHLLTEELDHAMGQAWLEGATDIASSEAGRYVRAWRRVGREEHRYSQLGSVLELGDELDRLTRKPGLYLMLKLMRRPAAATGLSSLQAFLEAGFAAFAAMASEGEDAGVFMSIIRERESLLMRQLFTAELVTCETELQRTLTRAQ